MAPFIISQLSVRPAQAGALAPATPATPRPTHPAQQTARTIPVRNNAVKIRRYLWGIRFVRKGTFAKATFRKKLRRGSIRSRPKISKML
jgi:hypothetical protein